MADYDPNAYEARVEEGFGPVAPAAAQRVIDENVPEGCMKVFQLDWWRLFFQAETHDVMRRALRSLMVFKGNFLEDEVS